MPLVLLRLAVLALGFVCLWRVAAGVQQSMDRAAQVAREASLPFTLLAAAILITALGYAFGKHRPR